MENKKGNKCSKFNIFKKFDLFGIEPGFYYKNDEKKRSLIGGIFTILYITGLAAFSIYKFNRLKGQDVQFYDSFDYINKSSINLTRDNFYGGFALEDPKSYNHIMDETIYYPKAYFKKAERLEKDWNWTNHEIELEPCKIEKFGNFFKNDFQNIALKNLYCFKEMNETLIGHFSANLYSFFFIELYPCKNTTENNNHCKPIEEINKYLNGTFVSMEFQDVELNPQNYSFPIRSRNQDIYFTVGKKLFKEVHIYYQIVNVETDLEKLGLDTFEEFKNIKGLQFLKYHSTNIMDNLIENNIYEDHQPFCSITIKLYDQKRIQRREYKKIFDVIGDIGGFSEILFLFLEILLFIPLNFSFKLDIVNTLFQFDRNRRIIKIKSLKNKRKKFKKEELIADFKNLSFSNNNNLHVLNNSNFSNSTKFSKNNQISNNSILISPSNSINEKKSNRSHEIFKANLIENIQPYKPYINYLLYFFIKRKANLEITFINDGMNLFTQKMDIFNIFKIAMKNKSANKEKQEEFMRDFS